MFFQINVTPKNKKDIKSLDSNTNDLHFTLVLGPFQPQTRITMEAFINTTVQCYLTIKNTSNKVLTITVTKKPDEDRHIDLDISHATILSNSNTTISIKWSPKKVGCWRDVLQFMDSRRNKYDVAIITTATNPPTKCNKPLVPLGQLTNRNRRPCEDRKILKNKTTYQESYSSFDQQIKKDVSRLQSNQNEENIANMNYKHTTKSFQEECDVFPKKSSDEFLNFIDSSAFNLTVVNTGKKLSNNKNDFLNKMQSIPSIILENTEIRRETYVKETVSPKHFFTIDRINKEICEDSLSPNVVDNSSEFSILINNLALEPNNVLETLSNQHRISTKGTSIPDNYKDNYVETMSVQTDGNGTYNLSPTLSISSHQNLHNISNRSLDLSLDKRDKFLQNLELCQSQKLSANLNNLSPIKSVKNEWANTPCVGILPSSSPIQSTSNPYILEYSTKNKDPVTAKDVLEADLWVKANNDHKTKIDIRRNIDFGTIIQENHVKFENTTLNKTQTFDTEKSSGICIEISPPKRYFQVKPLSRKMISPKKCGQLGKDKFMQKGIIKKKVHSNIPAKKNVNLLIPEVRISKLSLANVIKKKNLNVVSDQSKENNYKLQDTDSLFTKYCNPDPFAACVTEDPFISSTMYYDEKWVYNQEMIFKKWLNALLSPPEDLNTDVESSCVDIGKVWQSCKLMENSILAETREALSARYHTDLRLNALRKAANAMYRRHEIVHVLSRTTVCIEKGILTIRLDRDLHRDIGLQKEMLELFLSYNPLWLRIGLETIYGENIPLNSNNDLVGLTRFIITRFFSDPFLKKTYPNAYHRKQQHTTFITLMNKFMLKKFLFLVYFLDYSKINKLIRHDPCLFHKKANIKDSRSILLTFSREVLSGIGDLTKVLKSYEYVVSYKQTYLDEFDYAVTNIKTDLRDGVRLCRVMELISGRSDLTRQCRVPTISRLQKIHNVDIALKALLQCGCALTGNIDTKSIADGHREKTLSLLWQIIYKYQAPRFNKAAICIQTWWRATLWYIRVRNYLKTYKYNAACIIQRAWKKTLAKRKLMILKEEYLKELQRKEKAVRFLQEKWRHSRRGIRDRRRFLYIRFNTIKLQRWWKRIHDCRLYVKDFQNQRKASIVIQRQWRALKEMKVQRMVYINMRSACIVIQKHWRATLLMKFDRMNYLRYKNTIVFIQNRWRFKKMYDRIKREQCTELKAVRKIELWWKSILIMRHERNNFVIMKDAANTIENWWIGIMQQQKYRTMHRAAIVIQKNWRKTLARNEYLKKKVAVVKIETWYKCIIEQKIVYRNILRMKNAAICIQRWWKNVSIARKQRNNYLKLYKAAVSLQQWWRAIILFRSIREQYLLKKRSCLVIQTWWRMIKTKQQYMYLLQKRNMAATILQRKWRSTLIMRQKQKEYKQLKLYTIKIQKRWRTLQIARREYYKFRALKSAAINMQCLFRANKISCHTRQWYIRLKQSTIIIQSYWRMKVARKRFIIKKQAALTIQVYWRAYIKGKKICSEYKLLRCVTINIQRRYRSNKISRKVTQEYDALKKATIWLQIKWRAKLVARAQKKELEMYHYAAKTIQNWWWQILFVKKCKFIDFKNKKEEQDLSQFTIRQMYRSVIISVIKIQRWWRNIREKRLYHKKQLRAVRIIEKWWIIILKTKQKALAATIIQAAWKGYRIRQKESNHMSKVRQRLKTATETASPHETLGHRYQQSIVILKKFNTIGELSMCLASLSLITRLSPKDCINLCEHNLVDYIYEIYVKSNRSLPWAIVCLRATDILITFAKFPPTRSYVCMPKYALPTVKLLHDKLDHEELSLHVATLIWLLVSEDKYKKALTTCSQSIWLLNSVCKKIIKGKGKLAHYSEILRKQTNLLPSFKPDWSLFQKQHRIFTTIENAITAILEQLDIKEYLT
ncbi:PREDICTED: protein abnormal spindle isoform X1 [Polistes canadensis]|uniref:protein abnormal spindle isoform X1 n=1 Tax=Polistes canadensis TaxID=91411 RepID=UPI000718E1BE|nr:PREDICTED: protein abnormal spindle isoform X1 [Polistes canadensis]